MSAGWFALTCSALGGVFCVMGGQRMMHLWFGLSPDNWIGILIGAVVQMVVVSVLQDESWGNGFDAGRRDAKIEAQQNRFDS